MTKKIIPNIKISKEDDHLDVALIAENFHSEEIEVETATPRFFNFNVSKRTEEGWEYTFYPTNLEAQAVERWKIPKNGKIVNRQIIPNFEKRMEKIEKEEREILEDLYDKEEDPEIEEILREQAENESLDLESKERHKFEVSTRIMRSNVIHSACIIKAPKKIKEQDLPEPTGSDYQVHF